MTTFEDFSFSRERETGEELAKKLLGTSPKLFCLCSKAREVKVFDKTTQRYTDSIDHYAILVGGPEVQWPFEVKLPKESVDGDLFNFKSLGLGWMKPVTFEKLSATAYRYKLYFKAEGVKTLG